MLIGNVFDAPKKDIVELFQWESTKFLETLKKVIPIKIETKKIKIKIPAEHTGRAYGLIQDYKEKEDWLNDGSLEVILNIPIGIQSDFYDKLNNITHGSAITSEMKQEG